MDEELKRIEEEIRKAKEKRQALEDRKNRRMKQIRAKQERDRAAWLKRMSTVIDKTMSEMKGRTYFYGVTPEQLAEAVKREGIPEREPSEETNQTTGSEAGRTEKEDPAKETAEEKEARR
jgi:hypothetical protein